MNTRIEREKKKGRRNLNCWIAENKYKMLARHAKTFNYGNITYTMEALLDHPAVQAILTRKREYFKDIAHDHQRQPE